MKIRHLLVCILACVLWIPANAGRAVFPGYDWQVMDWNNRSNTNTGGVTGSQNAAIKPSTRLAATEFMRALRNLGLYPTTIQRLDLFAGNDFHTGNSDTVLGAVQTPLIADQGNTIDISDQAQSAWTYAEQGSSGGLSEPGVAGKLDTGYIANNAGLTGTTDAHLAVYVTVNAGAESTWATGAQDGTPNDWGMVGPNFTAVGTRGDIWKVGTAYADAGGVGFYMVNKESINVVNYKNGVSQTSTAPGGGKVTVSLWVFALNLNGARSSTSSRTLAGYSVGHTINDPAGYYAAWQRFQTMLGRQK